jgi:nickel-dependent lactate racemase
VRIDLFYGRAGLAVHLPEDLRVTVVRKHPMAPLLDPAGAVAEALRAPVGSPPLAELARGRRSACVVICDVTRPVPNGILLPPLLDTLLHAGIPHERVRILVATGLHRPADDAELREVVGSDAVLRGFPVENHVAGDVAAHTDLGTTSAGIPILVDRRFLEADLRIVVGLVEPHFMAGWSGGRKVVAPGIAGEATILALHSARILEHPAATNCVLEGNPLHQAQLEFVRAVGGVQALNVVIDERRRLGFVSFGEVEASHLAAVAFMRRHAEVELPRRYRTVLTTSAGYPLDRTYYQTVKGMVGALGILEPGGTVVIASECSEGMGSAAFVEAQRLLRRLGPGGFMAEIGWVTLSGGAPRAAPRPDTCVEVVDSVAEAVAASARAQGDLEVAVIPEGPYVIPRAP